MAGSVFCGTVLLSCPTASGYGLSYTDGGDAVRWWGSCYQYSIHAEGAPGLEFEVVQEAIRASFDVWEEPACSYFYFEETAPSTCEEIGFFQDRGNMNLLVWRTADWVDQDHEPDAIALTSLTFDTVTGEVFDADIEFNAEFFDFGVNGENTLADIQNTATHEIGHALGLGHSDDPSATMYNSAIPGDTIKRDLNEDDISGLCALYPTEDDPDICLEPLCGLDLDCTTTECVKEESVPTGGCSIPLPLGRKSRTNAVTILFSLLRSFV